MSVRLPFRLSFIRVSHSLLAPKDPDLEDAPVAPEMGTIELKGYRCQLRGPSELSTRHTYEDLHLGRISERSKKAGWHHVGYVPSVMSFLVFRAVYLYFQYWRGGTRTAPVYC